MSTLPAVRVEEFVIPRLGSRGTSLTAYLASPATAGPHPGVLVVHELCGFNDGTRAITRRLASEGYAALVVDLFSGIPSVARLPRAIAGVVFRPLNNGLPADLRCALQALRAHPEVDPQQVAAMGFSMGGGYALQLACVAPEVRAAAVFYGQNPRPLRALRRACPITASYAEHDFTTWGVAARLRRALETYGIPHDIKVYARLHHGFFTEGRPAYDASAATDAWQRAMTFFTTFLHHP